MSLLQQLNIKFVCTSAGWVNGIGGSELHGLIFRHLAQIDPNLSNTIHEASEKPFAISPLIGSFQRIEGRSYLQKDQLYDFNLSALDKEMSNVLPSLLASFGAGEITCGTGKLEFIEARSRWERPLSYESFFEMTLEQKCPSKIEFKFLSPTTFRIGGGRYLPLPEPHLVFGSLHERWQLFSRSHIPDWDMDRIVIAKYDKLGTSVVKFNNYHVIGFRGTCCYTLDKEATDLDKRMLLLLSRYATVASVGYKTTMSMGQVILVDGR